MFKALAHLLSKVTTDGKPIARSRDLESSMIQKS